VQHPTSEGPSSIIVFPKYKIYVNNALQIYKSAYRSLVLCIYAFECVHIDLVSCFIFFEFLLNFLSSFDSYLVTITGVGKSCLLLRFSDGSFTTSFITTIGLVSAGLFLFL